MKGRQHLLTVFQLINCIFSLRYRRISGRIYQGTPRCGPKQLKSRGRMGMGSSVVGRCKDAFMGAFSFLPYSNNSTNCRARRILNLTRLLKDAQSSSRAVTGTPSGFLVPPLTQMDHTRTLLKGALFCVTMKGNQQVSMFRLCVFSASNEVPRCFHG